MNQLFISSSCVNANTIKESVINLAEAGFRKIELSGGTKYYLGYENDLLEIKEKYKLDYLLHNYFPPPQYPFVINLASKNDELYNKSINLCKSAIKLSKQLNCKKYGIHAGFLIDIKANEIGGELSLASLSNRNNALKRFATGWSELIKEADDEVSLYVENNVFSMKNSKIYNHNNPLLFTDYNGYLELNEKINFTPLIDLAHLKVSCKVLKLDFVKQANKLLPLTDYIHISGNNGYSDQNKSIIKDREIISIIRSNSFKNKTITLEVYTEMNQIMNDYNFISKEIN